MRFFLNEMLKPAAHRAASWVSVLLAGSGFSAQQLDTIEAAAVLLAGYLVDLIVRKAV